MIKHLLRAAYQQGYFNACYDVANDELPQSEEAESKMFDDWVNEVIAELAIADIEIPEELLKDDS